MKTPQTARAEGSKQHSTPEQLVDALNSVFGKQQPGVRAVHAKGVDLEGEFRPADDAHLVSQAPHFQNVSVPISVRFSDFTGIPNISDTDGRASPRGMSIKFHLPDGSDTDIVAHSFNGFPAANADEFREFLLALASSKPGAPKPTPLDNFLSSHPAAKTFLQSQLPDPVSYATISYFGVNTFKFTNAQGQVKFGRYQIRPEAGDDFLNEVEDAKADSNYLSQEIRERVARAPVWFRILLEIAEEGDDLNNPSVAWPQSRTKVELGSVEITRAMADNVAAERKLFFQPGALTSGIEAQDPMIQARKDSYPVSYERRTKAA